MSALTIENAAKRILQLDQMNKNRRFLWIGFQIGRNKIEIAPLPN
jgi:hypothetical protein